MLKKMMLLAISVGALAAFAAPAAQGQQLYEFGPVGQHVPLAVKAKVTATSINLKIHFKKGTLECVRVTLHGSAAKNEASTAHIADNSLTFEECNTPVTDPTAGTTTIGSSTVGVGDNWTFKGAGCHFAGNIPFTYIHDTNTLTVVGKEQLLGTPAAECGNGTVTGSFTLETSDSTPVFIE